MTAKHDALEAMVIPVVEAMGCEFWGMEYLSQGRNATLRIFIEKEGGVQLEDCEKVSRQVSAVMDVEDPIAGEYTLEVSSPGMDRPLYTLAHYARFAGEKVELRLRVPFDGRRKFSGLIVGVEGDEVVVRVDNEEFLFTVDSIEKANIVPQF
ncbi:ribosome maturation factor RimP [Simiduia agarivorans]|uniref:Ribosome maturation factor RimP n=1 Tax=Simiduia agarivorans (strain DSM 21679 / JCM 13881 / BCRC 17597 / SA1) TaxID=1117647 RepID=K4KI44_SIMAS|nr:ribosome maturation factor RimP [Simiduia agarivorans]AFU98666.1 ribosome maturation protein RimP [Simiduia agarivorans SA1 = DSM 21679]